jgi:hypothetical protein
MNIILKNRDSIKQVLIRNIKVARIGQLLLLSFLLLATGCIVQFIPETTEDQNLLVVEGLITNQDAPNIIKISTSLPLGGKTDAKPLSGAIVNVTDDMGSATRLFETIAGTYVTPSYFHGYIGRSYTLHIKTGNSSGEHNYESLPMLMKPVPPIDSVYYEKTDIPSPYPNGQTANGAQVYLNTHDPENNCKFYRWEFYETWEFRLPYVVPNNTCWISNNSDMIKIKNTSSFAEDRIIRFPINLVSNMTDRLRVKYSILVNQYSLNEDEYLYWEKLQNISEQVGGLYDITPASVPSNIWCLENPNDKVLGYFSVSASTSKRIFIEDNFKGLFSYYTDDVCIVDTIYNGADIPSLNTFVWIIVNHPLPPPSYVVITRTKGCYDCTVRGTNIEPLFWRDDKKYVQKDSK